MSKDSVVGKVTVDLTSRRPCMLDTLPSHNHLQLKAYERKISIPHALLYGLWHCLFRSSRPIRFIFWNSL